MHAEVHCINQMSKRLVRQKKSLKKYSVLVIRIKRDTGELVYSKPCHDCIHAMRKYGIKTVYYSGHDGEIVMERVSQMSNRPSAGRSKIDAMGNLRDDFWSGVRNEKKKEQP